MKSNHPLRALEDTLAQVVMNLPFPAIVTENSSMPRPVKWLNQAFTETFGYTLEDVPTVADWFRLAYPDEAYRFKLLETWAIEVRQAFETEGMVATREVTIQTKQGQSLRVLVNGQALHSYLITSFVDVSEQRRAEAELRDVRYQLDRTAYELTENLPVGTYTMVQPPDGGLAQFRFMSTKFLELTGLTREAAYADPLKGFACVHPEDYDRWLELNARSFANREPFSGETRVVVNGRTRWITADSKPRSLPDGSVVWEGVLADITERKLAEQSLARAKAQAEKLERLKSDFLTHMSHEIRTPLTTILGLTDLLASDSLAEPQHVKVEKIQTAGKLLLGIINDILDLSKIEAGQLITEELPFDLNAVLATVEAFRASITRPTVDLTVIGPEWQGLGPIPVLIGDRRRLEQVLANLLSNAVKFTEQGQITVTFKLQPTGPSSVQLRVTVRDTGMGISPDYMAQLFTPFTQSDTGIARQYGGTGLGLSISKQLVELMGGHIHVSSQPGQGSTFWFELPLAINTQEATQATLRSSDKAPTALSRLFGLHILVVDDSPSIRDLIMMFLQREGATVELACDGAQALAILQDHPRPFDCVMMDVQMPVMDGLSAIQNIRALRQFNQLPVLAMTAGLLAEQQARARQAGMADVIAKPIDVNRMVTQLLIAVGRVNNTKVAATDHGNLMPVIAGIDRDHVNRTMDGNRGLFDRLITVFVEEFDGLDNRIATMLEQGMNPDTIKEAARLTHSLRGAASQIGAEELCQAAAAVEHALHNEAQHKPAKLDAMGTLLADLIDSLKRHLQGLA
jgi:PAS domain S-box-containing protein